MNLRIVLAQVTIDQVEVKSASNYFAGESSGSVLHVSYARVAETTFTLAVHDHSPTLFTFEPRQSFGVSAGSFAIDRSHAFDGYSYRPLQRTHLALRVGKTNDVLACALWRDHSPLWKDALQICSVPPDDTAVPRWPVVKPKRVETIVLGQHEERAGAIARAETNP